MNQVTNLIQWKNQTQEQKEELVDSYKKFIFYMLQQMQVPNSLIDDLAQEILLNLWTKLEMYDKEKTLEQKIQDKWPDKEVVMLEWGTRDLWTMRGHDFIYTTAQSMKGFHKYVYEQDNDLIASLRTLKSWKGKTLQPVAVLFERSEG